MPTLIIEQPENRTGGRIPGRVLIGRLPTNGIALVDTSVSRLHAWIDQDGGGGYYVADTGSLTGTRVNGRPIERRQTLADGDVIRVGQTQIVFSDEPNLPAGVQEIDLAGQPPAPNVVDAGVLFDCLCGAPTWVKAAAIGQDQKCRHCGRTIRVPAMSGVVAEIVAEAPPIAEPGFPVEEGVLESEAAAHAHEAMLAQPAGVVLSAQDHAHADQFGLSDSVSHREAATVIPRIAAETAVEPQAEVAAVEEQEVAGSNGEVTRSRLFESWRPEGESVAEPAAPTFSVVAPVESATQTCSACHTEINLREAMTSCPSCGLTFHTECWQENRGCSAYGCPQVGVLGPPEGEEAPLAEPVTAEYADEAPSEIPIGAEDENAGFPWEFLFLATSVLGVLMSAFAYGVPALIAAVGTLLYLVGFKDPRKRRGVLVVALIVCLAGAALGIWFSYHWYRGWPPPVARFLGGRGGRP